MAPKHPHSSELPSREDQHATKRIKSSPSLDREPQFKQTSPLSRSETPAETSNAKVPFTVVYPAMTAVSKQKLTKEQQLLNEELVDRAELHQSPFEAKGAHEEGEMDQHYVVLPSEEWLGMKKYNNFISGFLALGKAWPIWWKSGANRLGMNSPGRGLQERHGRICSQRSDENHGHKYGQ